MGWNLNALYSARNYFMKHDSSSKLKYPLTHQTRTFSDKIHNIGDIAIEGYCLEGTRDNDCER